MTDNDLLNFRLWDSDEAQANYDYYADDEEYVEDEDYYDDLYGEDDY